MNEIIYKQSPMGELLDADEKAGIVKGYASTFGNKDSDNDIINKGAYKKTIEENGKRIKYIYQHDMDKPLGVIKMLEEDNKGLMFEAKIANTTLGKDVIDYQIETKDHKHLKRFKLNAKQIARTGTICTSDGVEGIVTSGNISPILGYPIGFVLFKSNPADDLVEFDIRGNLIEGNLLYKRFLS